MVLVTVSTVFQTVFIAFFLLLSKGWKIARQSLSRGDLSSFTLLMGAVYLTYSAYYVSLSIPNMKLFVGVSIVNRWPNICIVHLEYIVHRVVSHNIKRDFRDKRAPWAGDKYCRLRWRTTTATITTSKTWDDVSVYGSNVHILHLWTSVQWIPPDVHLRQRVGLSKCCLAVRPPANNLSPSFNYAASAVAWVFPPRHSGRYRVYRYKLWNDVREWTWVKSEIETPWDIASPWDEGETANEIVSFIISIKWSSCHTQPNLL